MDPSFPTMKLATTVPEMAGLVISFGKVMFLLTHR